MKRAIDVIVTGGGPVGSFAALAMRDRGVEVLHVSPESRAAERPIALSHGSRQLIERLGAWPEATPIESVHVSRAGAFGHVRMTAADCAVPALGYMVGYSELVSALQRSRGPETGRVASWQARSGQIEVVIDRGDERALVTARLLVIAEGGDAAEARSLRDYRQTALVAEVTTDHPHRNIAWERFAHGGPIALLPWRDRHALVWTVPERCAGGLLDASDAGFLSELQAAFGAGAGRFLSAGPRSAFPLALFVSDPLPSPRAVRIGNAAQTLHTVAGQGLNLGLRDAFTLARTVARGRSSEEIGAEPMLRRYARARRLDRNAAIAFTDALARGMTGGTRLTVTACGAALALLDALTPARNFLARRMLYGASALP